MKKVIIRIVKTAKYLGLYAIFLVPSHPLAQQESTNSYGIFVNPITSLFGGSLFGVDISYMKNITLGAEVSHYSFATDIIADYIKAAGTSYGLRAFWYSNGSFEEGPFYVGKLIRVSSTVENFNSASIKSSRNSNGSAVLAGYGSSLKWREFLIRLSGGVLATSSQTSYFQFYDGFSETTNDPPLGLFADLNIAYIF